MLRLIANFSKSVRLFIAADVRSWWALNYLTFVIASIIVRDKLPLRQRRAFLFRTDNCVSIAEDVWKNKLQEDFSRVLVRTFLLHACIRASSSTWLHARPFADELLPSHFVLVGVVNLRVSRKTGFLVDRIRVVQRAAAAKEEGSDSSE